MCIVGGPRPKQGPVRDVGVDVNSKAGYTGISRSRRMDPNVFWECVKMVGYYSQNEKTSINYHGFGLINRFLDMTVKAQAIKAKINNKI